MSATLTIAACGDVFPNARFHADGVPISPGFARTRSLLETADLRFANVETPLSERGTPADKLAVIRAHPEVAADVAVLGLDVASVANNHVGDYGPLALLDTLGALRGIGVEPVGAGASWSEAVAPVVLERCGRRVGFLAFTCLVPSGARATGERPGVAAVEVRSAYEIDPRWAIEEPGEPRSVTIRTQVAEEDARAALARVRELRAQVDVLCVSVHWGYGHSDELAEYQRPLAHALVGAGADAVLGHHVHAVQGIEVHRGVPILYSPGTLVGQQARVDPAALSGAKAKVVDGMEPDGYVALLEFGASGGCAIAMVPVSLDGNGLPLVAEGPVLERIVERMRRHSARLDTALELREGVVVPVG